MPRTKSRLSPSEYSLYSSCWQDLRAEGIELGPETKESTVNPCPLRISAQAGPGEVFDLDEYRTGYVVRVHLVATTRVFLEDCILHSEWHPEIELEHFERQPYKLGPFQYRATEVLNQKLDDVPWVIQRGFPVEGVILAWAAGPLPAEITRGTCSVAVTITDALGQQSSGTVPVIVDRAATTKRARRIATSPGAMLRREGREPAPAQAEMRISRLEQGTKPRSSLYD